MSCFYFTGMDVMECDKDVTRSTVLTTSLRLIRGMKDYIWTLNEARMYETDQDKTVIRKDRKE